MLRPVGGRQFVRSTEVVRFSECPLSQIPLYLKPEKHALDKVCNYCSIFTMLSVVTL